MDAPSGLVLVCWLIYLLAHLCPTSALQHQGLDRAAMPASDYADQSTPENPYWPASMPSTSA